MSNPLRFTGDWPPPHLLDEYPNWEYALDEEGLEDQDETTIRPAENQTVIEEYVPFTAATALLPDGRQFPAIIELLDGVAGLDIYVDNDWYRLVRCVDRFNQFLQWEPYVEEWRPEGERCPSFSLADKACFPLRFVSRLGYTVDSAPIKIQISPDGSEEPW